MCFLFSLFNHLVILQTNFFLKKKLTTYLHHLLHSDEEEGNASCFYEEQALHAVLLHSQDWPLGVLKFRKVLSFLCLDLSKSQNFQELSREILPSFSTTQPKLTRWRGQPHDTPKVRLGCPWGGGSKNYEQQASDDVPEAVHPQKKGAGVFNFQQTKAVLPNPHCIMKLHQWQSSYIRDQRPFSIQIANFILQ